MFILCATLSTYVNRNARPVEPGAGVGPGMKTTRDLNHFRFKDLQIESQLSLLKRKNIEIWNLRGVIISVSRVSPGVC